MLQSNCTGAKPAAKSTTSIHHCLLPKAAHDIVKKYMMIGLGKTITGREEQWSKCSKNLHQLKIQRKPFRPLARMYVEHHAGTALEGTCQKYLEQ